MKRVLMATVLAALTLVILIAGVSAREDGWAPAIAPIRSPAGPNSASAQITTSEHGAVLSWLETAGKQTTLKFAQRTHAGWSEPRAIVSGDDFFANWADVPSVMMLANRTLVAHWLQKSGSGTYAYDVRLAHSTDEGRTWSASFTPHHDGTQTEHGFASLFQMPGAGLGLVWLDGRAMKPAHGHGESGGDMSLRSAVYDGQWKQVSEQAVDLRICECCPTAAAITSEGPIVAFRNRSTDEVRDIHVSRLVGGQWTESRAVHDDDWKINGCPVQGPALSARGAEVAVSWFTGRDDQGKALVAFSGDAGKTFGSPIRVDEAGALGRVGVVLGDSYRSAIVSWIELGPDRKARFMIRRVDAAGERSPAIAIADVANGRSSGYPRLARSGNELLLAWTASENGASQVRTAVAPLR